MGCIPALVSDGLNSAIAPVFVEKNLFVLLPPSTCIAEPEIIPATCNFAPGVSVPIPIFSEESNVKPLLDTTPPPPV